MEDMYLKESYYSRGRGRNVQRLNPEYLKTLTDKQLSRLSPLHEGDNYKLIQKMLFKRHMGSQ